MFSFLYILIIKLTKINENNDMFLYIYTYIIVSFVFLIDND